MNAGEPARLTRLTLPPGVIASGESIARFLHGAGVEPSAWSNQGGDRYPVHDHGYTKLLMCAAGSITFSLDGGAEIALAPGEGFVLPPGTPHGAVVGPDGCTCLEGHR